MWKDAACGWSLGIEGGGEDGGSSVRMKRLRLREKQKW